MKQAGRQSQVVQRMGLLYHIQPWNGEPSQDQLQGLPGALKAEC